MFLVFSNFSYSFFLKLLSSGVAIFITSASFWFFPTVNIIGWLVRNCLSYWNLRWSWRYYSPWFSGESPILSWSKLYVLSRYFCKSCLEIPWRIQIHFASPWYFSTWSFFNACFRYFRSSSFGAALLIPGCFRFCSKCSISFRLICSLQVVDVVRLRICTSTVSIIWPSHYASCVMTGRTYRLTAWISFFSLNWIFKVYLILCGQLFPSLMRFFHNLSFWVLRIYQLFHLCS